MILFDKESIAALLLTLLTATAVFAQNNKAALIQAYLYGAHRAGLFNGNVWVVDDGKVITAKAIGYADASKKVPLTLDYRFHIGSAAKEFDAVGIMLLQEQGKLSINDKVAKYFPGLPAWAGKISIKNLLQYTSGLPDIKYATVHGDADNWKDLQALQNLVFEPGTDYLYNNENTFLRRMIIQQVAGMPFNQFVQQYLLKPAGISNGVVDPAESDTLVARAFNNDFKQDGLAVPISGWTCLTAAGFYKWAQCINNFCLISPASTRELFTPMSADKQSGLGGGTMADGKVLTHVHDGAALHYQALLATDARKGRTIIILSNQRQMNVYGIAAAITAILDGQPYQPLAKTE